MKKKKPDKIIYDALNSDKPDRSVLDKAKAAMSDQTSERTEPKKKWLFRNWKAVAGVSVMVVFLAILTPIIIKQFDNNSTNITDINLEPVSIVSIEDYYHTNSANYKSPFLYYNYEVKTSILYYDATNKLDVYIKETYIYNDNELALSVLLNYVGYRIQALEPFFALTNQTEISESLVYYNYNGSDNYSYAKFSANNLEYMIAYKAQSEPEFLNLISLLIN